MTEGNFSQEALVYHISKLIELESYGYRFLRLNKFTLQSEQQRETKVEGLYRLLRKVFAGEIGL
jgi:hypothetical protein